MKNFDIFGFQGKIRVLVGIHKKPIYRGDCLKRGPWTVCRFKERAWQERGGKSVFEGGGLYPNVHYALQSHSGK